MPGSRKLVAWRDKLLIKGLSHSASEYLVAGKAAKPTQERALFLKSCLPGFALHHQAAGVGWGAGSYMPSSQKELAKEGVIRV